MNAFSVIAGEDVKIAGVKVGKIESLDVTPDHKAAIVLRIDRPGFDDFRTDAECTIRPQSLIGERFVECTPTGERAAGTPAPPPLRKIEDGPGKGQYLLPVSNTMQTVDIDLINNTAPALPRAPGDHPQRAGTGVARRGGDLRQAVINANPAPGGTTRSSRSRRPEPGARQPRPRQRHHRPLARDRPGGVLPSRRPTS